MEVYTRIPDTDLRVSKIALGTVNAGIAWDGADADNIFGAYVEKGGNLIDCARIYSDWVAPEIGRAERVLGDWIRHRGRHDDVIIITKCGHPRMETMNVSRLSCQEIESDLDLSLKALNIEAIDIYCYHRDDITRSVEELIDNMERFVKAGKIRYYACSNWSTERMVEADAYATANGYRGFVLNEALFNYGSARMKPFPDKTMVTADGKMLAYHKANLRCVLTPYMGLCSGFFHMLDAEGESAVKGSPYFTEGNLDVYREIKKLSIRHKVGITQVLIGYLLTRKPDMLALVSADNMSQLDAVMNTMGIDFSEDEFDV